jgi:predicted LPLAT superfamily acyltransferase
MSALRRAISTQDATARADALMDIEHRHPDLAATLAEAVDRNDTQAIEADRMAQRRVSKWRN